MSTTTIAYYRVGRYTFRSMDVLTEFCKYNKWVKYVKAYDYTGKHIKTYNVERRNSSSAVITQRFREEKSQYWQDYYEHLK